MKKFLFSLISLSLFSVVLAHQPRITWDQESSMQNPILVTNPENSQAFYGELKGKSDVYQIISDTGFLLYANIVIPDLTGKRTDFSLQILQDKNTLAVLDGTKIQWTGFYEEFAGDQYLRGPEWEKQVEPGTYTIIVSNPNNQGKYSLAIGKIESFPLNEIINTYKLLPSLKTYFFDKPVWEMFNNYIGIMTGGIVLILAGIATIIVAIVRHRRKKK